MENNNRGSSRRCCKMVIVLLLLISFGQVSKCIEEQCDLASETCQAVKPSTLINITDFKYLINNNVCGNSDTLVLFYVVSAPNNSDYREAIRNTWGQTKKYSKLSYKVLFILGDTDDAMILENIKGESSEHKDIIQGNFIDSYSNLTYKHILGWKWTLTYCPQVKYVIKVDDDQYVDIFKVIGEIKERFGTDGTSHIICCSHLFPNNKPYRDPANKYYVSYEEYSSDEPYPEFCSGAGIMYSMTALEELYPYTLHVNYFKLEDVYSTALVRRKAGLLLYKFEGYLQWHPDAVANFLKSTKTERNTFAFALTQNVQEIYKLWRKLMDWFDALEKNRQKL